MYNDGRISSESSIDNLPLSNSPHSGDMKRMSMRIAKIVSVDNAKNTVNLQWLWPAAGGISGVNLSRPYLGLKSGINFMPEIGSVIILGYAFNIPVILSYVSPTSYEKMLAGEPDSNGTPTRMKKINPGEIMITSMQGSEIYVHDQIELTDDSGDKITVDPESGTIQLDSLNFNVINEAGGLFMGMVKRVVNNKAVIITNDGKSTLEATGGLALTEMVVNIKEFADNTRNDNSSDPDIATLTMGTLVDQNGKKVLNELGNQIVLDITTSAGARVQIDKKGLINLNQGKMTTPTQIVLPNTDPLSTSESVAFKPLTTQQGAARNGDFISIPIVASTDLDHPEMNKIAVENLAELASKLAPFFRVFGVFPCVYTGGPPMTLGGQIVSGSTDVFIGSKDEKL